MIKIYKPTTAGRRGMTTLVRHGKKADKRILKILSEPLKGDVGRSHGKISVHHRQRGAKKRYRLVDFKREKYGISGTVTSIDYDPNRSVDLALVTYVDGEKRYILAPEGIKIGDKVISGEDAEVKIGNTLPLKNIPVGTAIHNIELYPNAGGKFVRSAGLAAYISAKEGDFVFVRMPSTEVRKFLSRCFATVGVLNNFEWNLVKFGKAGRKTYMGVRPTTRGKSRSSYDHPIGGSYRQKMGRQPRDLWGNFSKGGKTRSRSHTNKYIVEKRKKK